MGELDIMKRPAVWHNLVNIASNGLLEGKRKSDARKASAERNKVKR